MTRKSTALNDEQLRALISDIDDMAQKLFDLPIGIMTSYSNLSESVTTVNRLIENAAGLNRLLCARMVHEEMTRQTRDEITRRAKSA